MTISGVTAERTFALRQRVLRPHQSLDEVGLAGDDDADAGHYAAIEDGRVLGVASVRREAPPWGAEERAAWRLRGMATDEAVRGRGIGRLVLHAVLEHVRRHGGGLLWCSARLAALPFYERAGFARRGQEWEDPPIGAHILMWRDVPSGLD